MIYTIADIKMLASEKNKELEVYEKNISDLNYIRGAFPDISFFDNDVDEGGEPNICRLFINTGRRSYVIQVELGEQHEKYLVVENEEEKPFSTKVTSKDVAKAFWEEILSDRYKDNKGHYDFGV